MIELSEHEKDNLIQAVNEEFESLQKNQVWTFTKLPPERKTIGCKSMFKVNYNADGDMEKYKAYLMVKGFTQRLETDFSETFAPVVKYTSRTLLNVALSKDLNIEHLESKTVFLNGDLSEAICLHLGFHNRTLPSVQEVLEPYLNNSSWYFKVTK